MSVEHRPQMPAEESFATEMNRLAYPTPPSHQTRFLHSEVSDVEIPEELAPEEVDKKLAAEAKAALQGRELPKEEEDEEQSIPLTQDEQRALSHKKRKEQSAEERRNHLARVQEMARLLQPIYRPHEKKSG